MLLTALIDGLIKHLLVLQLAFVQELVEADLTAHVLLHHPVLHQLATGLAFFRL